MSKKSTKTEESTMEAAFARIPLEKLSGLDENLWLEPVSSAGSEKMKDSTQKVKEKK